MIRGRHRRCRVLRRREPLEKTQDCYRIIVHRASRGRLASVACRRVLAASVPSDPVEPASVPLHWPGRCGPAAAQRRMLA